MIGSGQPGAPARRPRSSSPCPAASFCRPAAFSSSTSAAVCADPRCSISRARGARSAASCTAVAPDDVLTVRRYGDTRPQYGPGSAQVWHPPTTNPQLTAPTSRSEIGRSQVDTLYRGRRAAGRPAPKLSQAFRSANKIGHAYLATDGALCPSTGLPRTCRSSALQAPWARDAPEGHRQPRPEQCGGVQTSARYRARPDRGADLGIITPLTAYGLVPLGDNTFPKRGARRNSKPGPDPTRLTQASQPCPRPVRCSRRARQRPAELGASCAAARGEPAAR